MPEARRIDEAAMTVIYAAYAARVRFAEKFAGFAVLGVYLKEREYGE